MAVDAQQKDAQQKIDAYLSRMRRRLRGLNDDVSSEIVAELRSHIIERATADGEMTNASVDAALAALGSAEELASEYVTDELLARAEVSRSPARVLASLLRWSSLSAAGFFVLLGSVGGYFVGSAFVLCALMKPFHPRAAGLWLLPTGGGDYELSLRMGFGDVPGDGRELLGWWIVPIGLAVGCLLVVVTTRLALWCAGLYRRSRALPRRS